MKTISVEDQQVDIYTPTDFPYFKFGNCSTVETNKRSKVKYVDCLATFDIETTTLDESKSPYDRPIGFMYVWQFCIDGIVVIGRTWKDFFYFINRLLYYVNCDERRLVIYVHNLSFEFQFIRNFVNITDIFCRSKRDVVYFVTDSNLEFRCSYALSNMSLSKFLEKTKGVTFYKQSGQDFNYHILRYPDTTLSDTELGYCVCDVLGLWQALKTMLIDDNLYTIPITSTGYVRRDFRNACLAEPNFKQKMMKKRLHEKSYILCREASRGAISGSNHIYTDEILVNVDSFDIKSSYPFQMATKYFPQSKFLQYNVKYATSKFSDLLDKYCCIIVWHCENLKLKHWSSIPYISKAKCRAIEGGKCGNGKVYGAKRIGMCCTEIDFKIIESLYTFDNPIISEIWCSQRGMLAKSFRETLLYMFQCKTDLEDGDPFLYAKYKNKINAAFGMMLTDILHDNVLYNPNSADCWVTEKIQNIEEALTDYYKQKNSFLSYQHGVYVLAHGRSDLVKGMNIVGHDIVQVDTDSVKTLGDYKAEFNALNTEIIAKADSYDVKPYAQKNGENHYLGIWEHEGKKGKEYTYDFFKTLGAKKYADITDNKMHITVAGLKKNADKWLQENGGLDAFKSGTVVPRGISGRMTATYNDWDSIRTITIDGHEITLGSNVAMEDGEYTFGMADEWLLMVLDGKINPEAVLTFNGAFKNY